MPRGNGTSQPSPPRAAPRAQAASRGPARRSPEPTAALRDEYRRDNPRPPRYVPPEAVLQAIADAVDHGADAATIRTIALREVQRARVNVSDKYKLFVPAGMLTGTFGLDDILSSICKEPQTAAWDAASPSVCDFVRVRGRGLRFTCTNRDAAIKLGGTSLRIMGRDYIIRPFSAFDRLYFVDLTNVPSDLDDGEIFAFFERLHLRPIITPTHQVGTLMSRDRTAWFESLDTPRELFDDSGRPLREIFFPGFDAPVYVQHKQRSLNRVLPPSIEKKRLDAQTTRAGNTPSQQSAPVSQPRVRILPRGADPVANPASAPPPAATVEHVAAVTLVKPEAASSLEAWADVTRKGVFSTPRQRPEATLNPVMESVAGAGRMVFGIPVQPTRFELAFQEPDDDGEAFEADADVFTPSGPVASKPLCVSKHTGALIASQSVLQSKRTVLPRDGCKSLARLARDDFLALSEPEARLAAISAQPQMIAPLLASTTTGLERIIDDHAILRGYSGTPESSHGDSLQLLPRMQQDYPDAIPPLKTILSRMAEDDARVDLARAYALMDLVLRTHAPSIYHDPIKVSALADGVDPVRLKFSEYLMWDDVTIHALCAGELGSSLEARLQAPLSLAFAMVVCDDPTSDNEEDDVDDVSSDASMSAISDGASAPSNGDASL